MHTHTQPHTANHTATLAPAVAADVGVGATAPPVSRFLRAGLSRRAAGAEAAGSRLSFVAPFTRASRITHVTPRCALMAWPSSFSLVFLNSGKLSLNLAWNGVISLLSLTSGWSTSSCHSAAAPPCSRSRQQVSLGWHIRRQARGSSREQQQVSLGSWVSSLLV